jgi:hypothetical protein
MIALSFFTLQVFFQKISRRKTCGGTWIHNLTNEKVQFTFSSHMGNCVPVCRITTGNVNTKNSNAMSKPYCFPNFGHLYQVENHLNGFTMNLAKIIQKRRIMGHYKVIQIFQRGDERSLRRNYCKRHSAHRDELSVSYNY